MDLQTFKKNLRSIERRCSIWDIGKYALVSLCDSITVSIYDDYEIAQDAKRNLDDFGCRFLFQFSQIHKRLCSFGWQEPRRLQGG